MACNVRLGVTSFRPTASTLPDSNWLDYAIEAWRQEIDRLALDKPDLIVLPEASDFDLAVPLKDHLAQWVGKDDRFLDVFSELAKRHNTWITLPTFLPAEGGGYYNSVRLINRQGDVVATYSKTQPTIDEMKLGIVPGTNTDVVETEFGKVAMVICFDLNFNELKKRYMEQQPDLILFCSMFHGSHVQNAWAYDCRAHLVSAVSDLPSRVISPLGDQLATTTNYTHSLSYTANLDCMVAHFDGHFDTLKVLKSKYGTEVDIHDPGLLGSVLITSRSSSVSARQMAQEFEIIPLDMYLDQSREAKQTRLGT